MAENNYTMKQWASALTGCLNRIHAAFLQNPQAAFRVIKPRQPRAFEAVLQSYLKENGIPAYLGECEVCQYAAYMDVLFKGPRELAHVTELVFGHWDNTPPNVIKASYLLTTPDEQTAAGLAVQLTDEYGGYSYVIIGQDRDDRWEISARDFKDHKKQFGPFLSDTAIIYYLLLNFLMHDECPSSPAKLKISRI